MSRYDCPRPTERHALWIYLTRTLSLAANPHTPAFQAAKSKGFKATGHAMRHAFKANCLVTDVNPQLTASIAGWTGSVVNEIMLNYGSEGLANSEIVKSLTEAQTKIHRHLLPEVKP